MEILRSSVAGNVNVLKILFSLLKTAKHNEALCDMVNNSGLTNKTKQFAVKLGQDILEHLCESVATRVCCSGREGPAVEVRGVGRRRGYGRAGKRGGVVDALGDLMDNEGKYPFTRNDGELLKIVRVDSSI